MKLSELFQNCISLSYDVTGKDVNYKFIEEDTTLYIYFQGSNSPMDWIRNFLFKKRPYKDMTIPYTVHRGFLKAWKEVEDIIIDKIKEIENDEFKWRHIIIIGYSHGGALSGLCHECVWFHRPDLREEGFEGYGFESPRFFGNFKVPKNLEERWKNYKVVRTNNDIVTHCPPKLFRFCSVGQMLNITGDTTIVNKLLLKCIKSHYPEVVENALLAYEEEVNK